MRRRGLSFLLMAVALVALAGCTMMRSVELVPQSHFTPPNANVDPIGTVTGEAGSTGFLGPDINPQLLARAYRNALAQKGGDLLINVTVRRKATLIYLLVPIWSTTVSVSGTAVKMRVGQQQLTELQRGQLREMADQTVTTVTD